MDIISLHEVPTLDLNQLPQHTPAQLRRACWILDFCQTDFRKARGEERTKWNEGLRAFARPFSDKKPIYAKYIDVTWYSLHHKLRDLREGKPWDTNVTTRLVLRRAGRTITGEAQFKDLGPDWIVELGAIALGEVVGLLTICANKPCERLFIREKRQAYCSLRCRDTVNKRAYRKRQK